MIACLRAARFILPTGGNIHVELRRHHDLASAGRGGADTKHFTVAKRMTAYPRVFTVKRFDALTDARAYWVEQVTILEDQGFERRDPRIAGFHEED